MFPKHVDASDLAIAEGAGDVLRDVAIQAELAIQKRYDDIPDLAQAISFFRAQGFEPSAFAPNKLDEAAADRRERENLHRDEVREGGAAFAEKRQPRF